VADPGQLAVEGTVVPFLPGPLAVVNRQVGNLRGLLRLGK